MSSMHAWHHANLLDKTEHTNKKNNTCWPYVLNTHHVIQRIERKALRTRLYVISPRPRVQGYTRKKNSYIIQEAFSKTRLRVQRPCLLFPTTTLQSQEIRPSRRPSSQLPSKAIMLLLEDKSEVGAAAAVCVAFAAAALFGVL